MHQTPQNWKKYRFADLAKPVSEKYDPITSDKNYPCIELEHLTKEDGKLLGFIDSKQQASIKTKFKEKDVLFGKLRPYLKKFLLADFVGVCTTEIWALRANENVCLSEYLFRIVQTHHFIQNANTTSGSKMPRADWDWVSEFALDIPPLGEQKKIAEILSTWDKAVETTEKLIAAKQKLKKSLMQRLLTGSQRFPEFHGQEWKEVRLKDVFERVTRKNVEVNTNVVTISAQRGFVRQSDYFNKNVASEILDNYFLVKKGEFCYNKSYSNGYPWGATKRLNDFDKAVVTTLYICFGIKNEKETSGNFFEQFFESNLMEQGLAKVAHEGGRAHGLLNVTPSDFFNLKITIPAIEEQKKIAAALNASDAEVNVLQSKLAALRQQKRGLMQKLLTGETRVKTEPEVEEIKKEYAV